ncbi:MAG: transcriptional regulator [Archaeoglobi archaeon]|uniref:PAS domain-containing protein n=1 Tax=Geoglobus ahangari TaxID=113653 RepID=UPI00064EFA6A|nr:PAS domain-containing protein [Geoglobus ahangari]NOY10608.1 transcriptional regulator [Archaeoglobi archaeon]
MSWSLTDKELKIISILKSGKKMSAREVKRELESDGIKVPYTTVSSALEKLYSEGILERKEVRSRGRYGKKYLYYLNENIMALDSSDPLAEVIKNVFTPANVIHSNDSVAFIDKKGILTFLYGNSKIINDSGVIGKSVEELHSKVTAKFVRQIFEELRNRKKDVFRRTVTHEGKEYEKFYCAIRSSDDEFLGVLVITRPAEESKKLPPEVIYP